MIYLGLVFLSVSALFSLYRQLEMLQQNSYFPSRYFKWVTDSFTLPLAVCSILFCFVSLLFAAKSVILFMTVCLLVAVIRAVLCFKTKKNSIKPLVFTKRVWRLYITAAVTALLLIALAFIFKDSIGFNICFTLLCAFCSVTPLFALFIWCLTLPIEKAFAAYYVHDAKRILKEHNRLTVIGVTGSYGKTTTKFILNRILSEKFNTVCTPQSFNTPMGVVRTIREKIEPKTQIFVCEMGAKNIGDIKEICDIVSPAYGIVTSVGEQHLDTFKSVDNVFKTKFELADACLRNGGVCFADAGCDEISKRIDTKKDTRLFGNGTDFYIENAVSNESGSSFDLVLSGNKVHCYTKLLGRHSLTDILAAATVAYTLGVGLNDIAFAISSLKPTEHRLELKPFVGGSLVIDDAYNSNPVGCLEAVRVLGDFKDFCKTVITPGLIELGQKEYECNYRLGEQMTRFADKIILVGKMRSKPMLDAIEKTDFDKNSVFVVQSFKEGLEIYKKTADSKSVLLIENDLPDNYLN